MLKFYYCIILIGFSIPLFSQTTIAKQSFELAQDTWQPITFSTPPCTENDDIWNYQTTLNTITPSDGDQFWGIQDLNGSCGSTEFEFLSLPNIDISNFRNVIFSFDYNVFEFDGGDKIKYELFFDDQSQGEITIVDGTFNSNGWLSENVSIPNSISKIKIIISVKQNGQADYAGIDNIKLTGTDLIACSELFISEYIEGTSGSGYRNNYIEIYNPSNQVIDLSNYDLTKYTNDNLNSTGSIPLIGSIDPFGTFLIEDIDEILGVNANLSSSSSVMDFTGNDKIALRKDNQIIDLIGHIGDNSNFAKDITLRRKSHVQNPNNQYNEFEWDVYGLEDLTNINTHQSSCSGAIPEIMVQGNWNDIVDGSLFSSTINNTYFGSLDPTSENTISKSFYIKNLGNAPLQITDVFLTGTDTSNFNIENIITSNIAPNDSVVFVINFKPSAKGIKTAVLQINNNDTSESPFNFTIQGEGTGSSNSPLIISQYYEGEGNNKWIEITNASNSPSATNFYYLALYRNSDANNPIGVKPSAQKLIPSINAGSSLKYRASLNVQLPAYALDGNEINTNICTFDGNDIILISTSNDETCWENKIDIIGNSSNWGANKSFVRKYGCESAIASTGFNSNDWLVYTLLDIDSAIAGYNPRIGEHFIGSTSFDTNNNWNNGLPDMYRNIILNQDYNTNTFGDLEACNITISTNKILEINANNYLSIKNNLQVDGELIIRNQAALLMLNNDGNITNNGSIKVYKTTTPFKPMDYTYWSSPIQNAQLSEVFYASPQNSFYKFETQNFLDANNDAYDDDENAWQKASETMEIGRGYTAMAPNTEPFINTQTVVFNGDVNNGNLTTPVYLSIDNANEEDDWNLIGNPYPSAIDAEVFLNNSVNKNMIGSNIYFWTHNTNIDQNKYSADDYAMFNVNTGGVKANSNGALPTKFIASCQGFFIEAKQAGNIVFNNEMRVATDNNNFFKNVLIKPKKPTTNVKLEKKLIDKIWLNLYNKEGVFSQILIGFLNGATKAYESSFDGLRFSGNNFFSFSSFVNKQQLAIQGLPLFTGDENITLAVDSKIEEPTKLNIGIDHLEGNLNNQEIYLEDKLLNITHSLSESDYTFTVQQKGLIQNRFLLKFSNFILSLEGINNESEALIISNSNDRTLQVKTSKNSIIRSLIIYDMLGRKLLEVNEKNKNILIVYHNILKNGVFIIYAKLDNSQVLTKKFIK
ncbi:MAG: lamin tail domain-containing protein [Flavobacteriaceae bacterium]|nr:lamin tail domain-containing protein [Flavobacteriaceae bacterium]